MDDTDDTTNPHRTPSADPVYAEFRCLVLGERLGWARIRPTGEIAVNLDGEGGRVDWWHPSQVERVQGVA